MASINGVVTWIHRWWRGVVAALGAIAAFAGAFWGALAPAGVQQISLFALGVVGTLTATLLPILNMRGLHRKIDDLKYAELQARREGREELLLIVDFALKPLLDKLGPLVRSKAGSRKRGVLASELKMVALSALKEIIDPTIPMLRANYFKLKYGPDGAPYLLASGSTAAPPRDRFDLDSGTKEADAILNMLAEDGYVFTPNCAEEPPPGFDAARSRSYETFISASASDGYDRDGMLTVDSPISGSLTEADAYVVRLVATIIAISETINDGKKMDP